MGATERGGFTRAIFSHRQLGGDSADCRRYGRGRMMKTKTRRRSDTASRAELAARSYFRSLIGPIVELPLSRVPLARGHASSIVEATSLARPHVIGANVCTERALAPSPLLPPFPGARWDSIGPKDRYRAHRTSRNASRTLRPILVPLTFFLFLRPAPFPLPPPPVCIKRASSFLPFVFSGPRLA